MKLSDPIFEAVTAPGTPFELGDRGGMRRFVNLPDSIDQMIERARSFGDRICVVEGDRQFSYAQLFERRDALAAILDIQPGDRVAICMRNRFEWMVAFLAALRCGGIAALLNSRGSPAELCLAIDEVSPAIVLADRSRAALLREGGYQGRLIEAADFPETGTSPAPPPAVKSDPAAILFTSGTTGRVKGAVLSHENLMTGILGVQLAGTMVLHNKAQELGIPVADMLANLPQQSAMLVVPLFHISGLSAGFLSALLAGSKIVIMRRWTADAAMELIAAEQITNFSGVPTMMWDIVHAGRLKGADLSSLRNIGMGGQAMPVSLINAIQDACPGVVIGTGYGLTETAGSLAMSLGDDFIRNRASAGRVLSMVDMQIRDADGNALPAGQVGEIVVRGPMVMAGYWQRPDDTAAVLSPDGWFHTGDIGMIDGEGYIFIIDRTKDMVISGGENIYCAEVERVMNAMPQIVECAAFGIPDDRLGEVLVAQVVSDQIDPAEIIAEVAEKLARYKAPAEVRIGTGPLPRNDSGKIDKRRLKDIWMNSIKAPAA